MQRSPTSPRNSSQIKEKDERDICDICGEPIEWNDERGTDGKRIFHPNCWHDEALRGPDK